eukprot:8715201-Alexandrium_andersonii.AAC.1
MSPSPSHRQTATPWPAKEAWMGMELLRWISSTRICGYIIDSPSAAAWPHCLARSEVWGDWSG